MSTQLSICTLLGSQSLAQSLEQFLSSDRYTLTQIESSALLLQAAQCQPLTFDCLIVQSDPALLTTVSQLHKQGILFPTVILKDENIFLDYVAVVEINLANLPQISRAIESAIAKFLNIPITANKNSNHHNLLQQQQQLIEKFPDKSCYIIGSHQREFQTFFQQMSFVQKQALLHEIKLEYRQILLNYFCTELETEEQIDHFINKVFCINIPVSCIIEIHMSIVDEFSKQLKIEGRSDDILLDYRLTLIDILAHLCEVYRRSIPN